MKRFLAIALTLVLLVTSLVSCGTVDDIAAIEKAGKIVVGITNYEPMDFKAEGSDKWIGFDAELAEQFAASLGVECVFFEIVDWNNKVADLNSKEIDLVWNGMTASDKLGKQIDFSTAYAKNAQVVVVKKGSTITKDGLTNLSIAVENGSAGATVADEIIKPSAVNKVKSQRFALNEVNAGTSDAAVIDLTMAQSLLGKGEFSDLVLVEGAQYSDEVFAVGLRKGSNLKEKLNTFLAEKYADGTMDALSEKYNDAIVINTDAFSK